MKLQRQKNCNMKLEIQREPMFKTKAKLSSVTKVTLTQFLPLDSHLFTASLYEHMEDFMDCVAEKKRGVLLSIACPIRSNNFAE